MSEKTIDLLQTHLGAMPKPIGDRGYKFKDNAQGITCKDGVTLSVQASRNHYCRPREDLGPYTAVEIGFPSVVPPESWMEYCEDTSAPMDTVYGYVPIALAAEFIDAHGGIDFEAMREKKLEAAK